MQRYESYKPSGADWLGDVPTHWDVQPLRAVTALKSDKNRPELPVLSVYREYGVILKDSRDDNHNATSLDTSAYKVVKPGDLVVNKMKAWQGSMGVSAHDGIVSPAYITCATRADRVRPQYLHYLLRSTPLIGVYNSLSYGVRVGQWDMHYEDFKQIPIPLPPQEEQERIVAFLDQKTAEIDAAIAKKERLIETLKEKRKVQISKAVTQGLNLSSTLKDSGSAAIGRIPIHWETRRLKHATRRIYDCKNRTPDYFPGGQFFVVRTTNVKKGRLVMEGALYTDAKGFSEWTRKGLPKAGELVITREAPAGEVALLPSGFVGCLGQRMMGIVPDEQQVLAKFLLYFLQSDAFDQYVILQGSGSTVSHLRVGQVFDIPLAFPPTAEEQQKIVDYLEEEDRRTDLVIQQELKAIRALQEFKSNVIASTVSGRLKV